MIDYIKTFYNIYLMDKKLSIYNKVILFCSNCIFFAEQEDVKLYESKKIKIYKI